MAPTLALVLLAGYAQAASLAWPFSWGLPSGQPFWWLQLFSLGILAWAVNHAARWREAFWFGWVFAIGWLTGTFWWLFISLHTYAGLPAALAALAVVALAATLGLYYAAICGLFKALALVNTAWKAIIFAALWMLAELARGVWFTGFGWGAVGYAHLDGPLALYAPWVGAYGLCFISAWLAMSLGQLRVAGTGQRATTVVILALSSVLALSLGAERAGFSRDAGQLSVTLLQGNIAQDEKFQPGTGVVDSLKWYGSQLQLSRTQLVVAPETAIPLLPRDLPEGYWQALEEEFKVVPSGSVTRTALLGIPLGDLDTGYTNSVIGLAPGRATQYQYDKHHLVPFGEFIPPLFKWFTEMMNIPLGDFNRGAVGQASFEVAGQRLAPNVCYEDLFGEELGARFADESSAPTIFVNVSNIGWFGDSVAIDQHLQISRMRALEFERPFVRATNTGATVIMDHRANVIRALPRLTRGVLTGDVQGRTGITPFAWWVSRLGLWPYWLLVIGLVALATALQWRKGGAARSP